MSCAEWVSMFMLSSSCSDELSRPWTVIPGCSGVQSSLARGRCKGEKGKKQQSQRDGTVTFLVEVAGLVDYSSLIRASD